MSVSPRTSGTAPSDQRWILLGTLLILIVGEQGPSAGAPAQEVPDPRQPSRAELPETPGSRLSGPSGEDSAATAISGSRELLRRYGLDQTQFRTLVDGRPVSEDETEILLKVMLRIRDFRTVDRQRWARDELDLAQLVAQTETSRGELFRLSGRVTRVEPQTLRPEVAQRFELAGYARCEFRLGDGQPAVVFAAAVPRQWPKGEPMDAGAGAFAVFLKLATADPNRPMPVFVTRRMAWYPPTPLGSLGMDVALLDDVVDRTGLGRTRGLDQQEAARATAEREAFYAMLDAVARAKPGQLSRQAAEQLKHVSKDLKRADDQGNEHFSVVPLFMKPGEQRGRLVVLSGRARRVVRIDVDDADIVDRFGIDHYFEISLFTDDSEGNPLVFCVRELPSGMPTGDGPDYGEQVRVAGFFLKLWSYYISSADQPPQPDTGRGPRRQPAPLLIGRQAFWYPRQAPVISPTAGAIAGGLFVLALLGIWLAVWQTGRRDKRFHARTVARTLSADPHASLNEIALATEGTDDSRGPEETSGDSSAGKQ